MNIDAIANVVAAVLFWGFLGGIFCSFLWSEFVGMGKMFIDLGRLIVELAGDVWDMLTMEKQIQHIEANSPDDVFPLPQGTRVAGAIDRNRSVPLLSDEAQALMANMALIARAGRITLSVPSQGGSALAFPSGQHNTALLALMKKIECEIDERQIATPIYQIGIPGIYGYLDEDGRFFDYSVCQTPPMGYTASVEDDWTYGDDHVEMEEGKA